MFTKKPKLDPKIRFQKTSFKHKLQEAREYKREPKRSPETPWSKFTQRLTGIHGKILLGFLIFFILAIYIIYIPNIFYFKQIVVSGASEETNTLIKESILKYKKQLSIIPNANYFTFSHTKALDYLQKNNRTIAYIQSISKKFPNTIEIRIANKVPVFALDSNTAQYILAQDGTTLQTVETDTNTSTTPNLYTIHYKSNSGYEQGDFSENYLNKLAFIFQSFSNIPGFSISNITIDQQNKNEPIISINTGATIYIAMDKDLQKIIEQTKLVLNRLSNSERQNLFYINLKYEDRAYTCTKNSPCANTSLLKTNSTTTSEIIK